MFKLLGYSDSKITELLINTGYGQHFSNYKLSEQYITTNLYKNEYFESNKLFIQVLEGLHTWKKDGELLSVIEIKKALAKSRE